MVAPLDPRRFLQQFWMWFVIGSRMDGQVNDTWHQRLRSCAGAGAQWIHSITSYFLHCLFYHPSIPHLPIYLFSHSCRFFLGGFCVCVSASLFVGAAIVGCLLLPRCRFGSTLIIIISLAKVRLCWWLPHVCFPLLASNTTLRCAAYDRSDIVSASSKVSNLCWSISFPLSHKYSL